ncbi:putative deoxycytidylate deaminase [Vibrio phage vB_VmeM-32]|nr:putative deoxycytidylate deaminase [Vibrio phage vB_VmeM-32]
MKILTGIQTAFLVSQESKCVSYKVGAVIELNDSIISMGVNGTASGTINPDEYAISRGWAIYDKGVVGLFEEHSHEYSKWANERILHAEQNAILFAAKNGRAINNATMYVTMSPCSQCAKLIAQSGIKTLVYVHEYTGSQDDWKKYLSDAGVNVIHVSDDKLKLLNINNIVTKVPRYRYK